MTYPGCLAQLGEHLFDVQEVTGSIPVAPTSHDRIRIRKVRFFFDLDWTSRRISLKYPLRTISSVVEHQLPKLVIRVRFPHRAPHFTKSADYVGFFDGL